MTVTPIMIEATKHPLNGWTYYVESFMGVGFYARQDSTLAIYCTTDWEGDGILAIEVQTSDGDVIAVDDPSFPHNDRSLERWSDLVMPWLTRFSPDAMTRNALIDEYAVFRNANNLGDLCSADEHLHDESLTVAQREWLRVFVVRWNEMERTDRS